MKMGKATVPGRIAMLRIEAPEELSISKLTNILNEIYYIGQIPE